MSLTNKLKALGFSLFIGVSSQYSIQDSYAGPTWRSSTYDQGQSEAERNPERENRAREWAQRGINKLNEKYNPVPEPVMDAAKKFMQNYREHNKRTGDVIMTPRTTEENPNQNN